MCLSFFFFSSRRRHTRCALVTGVQTCALPIFSLSANARVVVNEFVYNPAGTTNAMGVSLIQGTFVFVTGEIAPSGEMDVATPVGTIGIRGTTVGVRIATFSGATRIVNIENPETQEVGSFTLDRKSTRLNSSP